ncbi:flagellin [Blastococcus sp. TML/M2B]|uniref:flagellin N-terminal helical domain-containing protein n=1 Tax=unclassified Blastococcus TaxID=2619396 RepID=UPI00190C2508|nr:MULTISPECIES: flagellin [unclassified Blastococcus]MBN1091621.1 flagellin [Blastococcus sp. TML/M2B]MBN1094823.1 flagellin [Blastococcus sp. TML/C7B]
MGLSVNTNIAAMNAYRNLSNTDNSLNKSLEKLSSGYRINRAADDAAGLAISEGLRSQIGGLKVAIRNTQDGVSVVQTAEGALTETHAILQRMRDLAVQSSNGSNDADSRSALNSEATALKAELTRIADKTTFNNVKLLDGSFSAKDFQVGYAAGDTIAVAIKGASAGSGFSSAHLGVSGVDLSSASGASAAIGLLDTAIKTVSTSRADLGALQNRFEHTIKNLSVTQENLSASESRIRDTDMAQEMTNFSRNQILSQAGTSMLAQANSASQNILKLLG